MSDRPLIVYLDSADFSVMSDPKRGHEWASEREGLMRYVADGQIRCAFSHTHLVEMAPVDRAHADLAIQKIDLLAALCGNFALPFMDRLITHELAALREGRPRDLDVTVEDGSWYPPISDLVASMGTMAFTKEDISGAIAQYAGNRAQRRAAGKKLLKKGRPSSAILQELKRRDSADLAIEIAKTFPMRDQDAKALARYVCGQATVAEAQDAFEMSLKDPRLMFRWFASEDVDITKFNSWLRKSSVELQALVATRAEIAKWIRDLPEEHRDRLTSELLARAESDRRADQLIADFAQRFAADRLPGPGNPLPLAHLHDTCAGLTTMIRTFLDAAWTSTTEQPRLPLPSDFPDALHAIYAPYVDIFRPDGYTAPHVARHVKRFGTKVVPKLRHLLPAIEECLARQRTAQG
ncbi:MAG: hypothetical protein U1E77_10005 [Inhella sp.]